MLDSWIILLYLLRSKKHCIEKEQQEIQHSDGRHGYDMQCLVVVVVFLQ